MSLAKLASMSALLSATIASPASYPYELTKRADIGLWPAQNFTTADFHPPTFVVTKNGEELEQGLIFITPALENVDSLSSLGSLQATGTTIVTDDGQLVWQGPHSSVIDVETSTDQVFNITTNLMVQELDGEPILTHWIGYGSDTGRGYGSVAVYNTSYSQIYTVCPELDIVYNNASFPSAPKCFVDLHESFVTPSGSMIISVANITSFDLSPINGPANGWVYDSQFYEVDIKTNEILFRWSSVESGIPITYTKLKLGEGTAGNGTRDSPFDWFHVNAISSAGDGYLVNSRHCWTTWMLDESGTIQWKIEGNNTEGLSDFTLPTDGLFEWQHHARYQNLTESGVTLHYFNNRNSNFSNGTYESNGLELNLNLLDYTVTVEKKLTDPSDPIYTESQGAFNPLANGNTFMGWGSIAKLKEFGPNGNSDVRLTMQFGGKDLVQSYRAYRQSWNATPIANPAAVGRNSTAWMSWNGATDHTAWNVYAGTVKTDLSLVGTVQRNNMFEVSYPLPSDAQFLQVAAYREATWLRNSSVVTVGPLSHPVGVGNEEDECDA